jgi:4-amino-4-deoxy-L-arabinose transferase-like glycosyltransferase
VLWRLGGYSLVNGDEALYHAVAESMAASGDWLELRFRGEPRIYDTFMNAPTQYWARAALISLFGSNLWTARILSALCAIGAVLATWRLGAALERGRGAWPGFAAGLALLTSFQFVYLHSARTGELEGAVSLCLVLAALAFLGAVERRGSFLGHHAAVAALATLKLPLAVVPVAAGLLYFALVRADRPQLRRWLRGGLALAPVALAWHVAQAAHLGASALEVLRMMGGQASGEIGAPIGSGPHALYYAGVALFGAWPHALAWPWALASVLRRELGGPDARRWLVPTLYAALLIGFFLLVRKRAPWYVLPAYPFLCVFLGSWLASLARGAAGRVELAAAAVLLSAIGWVGVPLTGYDPFALDAVHMPMSARWRGPGGAAALAGLASCALVAGAALHLGRVQLGARSGAALAALVAAALYLPAALRVSAGLAFLGRQSPLAQLARELEERRAAGVPLAGPVDVPSGNAMLARYYFGDAWSVVPALRADGTPGLRLVPKARSGGPGS